MFSARSAVVLGPGIHGVGSTGSHADVSLDYSPYVERLHVRKSHDREVPHTGTVFEDKGRDNIHDRR